MASASAYVPSFFFASGRGTCRISGRCETMVGNRLGDVVDALVGFVVRMKDPGGVARLNETHVQIRRVAIVDACPVVLARPYDAHQPIQRIFQQIGNDAARAAVEDAGPYDDRAQAVLTGVEHRLFVRRPPGDVGRRPER